MFIFVICFSLHYLSWISDWSVDQTSWVYCRSSLFLTQPLLTSCCLLPLTHSTPTRTSPHTSHTPPSPQSSIAGQAFWLFVCVCVFQCPMFKTDESGQQVPEPYAEECKYFTESRLLQRDVQMVLEGVSNQNLLGTVLHPVRTHSHHSRNVCSAQLPQRAGCCWHLTSSFLSKLGTLWKGLQILMQLGVFLLLWKPGRVNRILSNTDCTKLRGAL